MQNGKNFSGNTNKSRHKNDFYQTPYFITRRLLDVEKFNGSILEPACGGGAIVSVLKEYGYKDIESYDLMITERDFLLENNKVENIITNPPFSKAREFILHSLKVASKKIAFLLPLNYLHGKQRFDEIYKLNKLQKVYVFTRYPMLSNEIRTDGKYNTGMMVYAWYIFDNNYNGQPSIYWLDNNDDIINVKG